MHTITDCPRCKKDFMYHQTDYHLRREPTLEQKSNLEFAPSVSDLQKETPLAYIIICQECDEKEKTQKELKKEITEKDFEESGDCVNGECNKTTAKIHYELAKEMLRQQKEMFYDRLFKLGYAKEDVNKILESAFTNKL